MADIVWRLRKFGVQVVQVMCESGKESLDEVDGDPETWLRSLVAAKLNRGVCVCRIDKGWRVNYV